MENEVDVTILPKTEDLVAWLVWLVPVIFLLLWDVWKAWKRRAPWIPGQALVLGALIIQLLSFVDYSRMSGRLMMCVLIAYLLPVIARSGSLTVGSDLTALALSVTFHVVSVVRSVWKVEKRNESLSALAASSEGFDRIISTILILAVIYLLVLLMKAVMSGRTICRIRSQKIPSALSCCCTPCDRPSYNDIKDHVLKCWIAVRFSQPDYVLVRTGVCSKAFPFVTVCIVVHVIQWICIHFTDNESLNSGTKSTLVQFVIAGHYVIVAIGWIVLLVRWVHSYTQGDTSRRDYLYSMITEDAQIDLSAFCGRLWVRAKRTWEKFCKRSVENWRTSPKQMLLDIITTVIEKVQPKEVPVDSQYEDTVRKILLPDESAPFLWWANQRGFKNVERYMDQGQEDGESSPPELIGLLRLQTVTGQGKKAKKRLQRLNKKSWKRTAVSLIYFMIEFYDGLDDASVIIEKSMQCYIQALQYMNFVDGLNEEVKSLGRQADKEFKSLQHSWHQRKQQARPVAKTTEDINLFLQQPLLPQNDCLFETWTVIKGYFSASQQNNVGRLQGVLANVYFVNMTKGLNKAVLRKCSKLAEEGMEEEILDVAFLAAKAQGVLSEVREGHNTHQGSDRSSIQTEDEEAGNNSRNANASGNTMNANAWLRMLESLFSSRPHDSLTNQTEIAAVGEGNDPENPGEDNTKVGNKSIGNKSIVGNNSIGNKSIVGNNSSEWVGGIGDKSVGGIGDKSVGSVGHNSVGGLRNRNNNNNALIRIE